MEINGYKQRIYACQFRTPVVKTYKLKESFVTPMMEAYESDGLISPKPDMALPKVSSEVKSAASSFATQPITADTATDPNVVVGVDLCRWFATHELDALCDETVVRNGSNGEWIDGTVVEIGKRTKNKKAAEEEAFCSFDRPISGSLWFSLSEAKKMAQCFEHHRGTTGSEVHVFQKPFAPIPERLCKGLKQNNTILEACALLKRAAKVRLPSTPSEAVEDESGPVITPAFRKLDDSSPDSETCNRAQSTSPFAHERGALPFVTTLGLTLNMSSILHSRPGFCVPFRCHGIALPFKVLPIILHMLEGVASMERTSQTLAACLKLGVMYKRQNMKLKLKQKKMDGKASLSSIGVVPVLPISRDLGALSLVTTLGYKLNMSTILLSHTGFCVPLQYKGYAIPFKVLPIIIEMLDVCMNPTTKAETFAACSKLSVLYKRRQLKWDQQRKQSAAKAALMVGTTLVVPGPPAHNNASAMTFPMFVPRQTLSKEAGSAALPLVVTLGLRLNMSAIVIQPNEAAPFSTIFQFRTHILTYDIVLIIIDMLHGTMDDTLRSDTLLNCRTLVYRFAYLECNPDDEDLICDDATDEFKFKNVQNTETTEESKRVLGEIKDNQQHIRGMTMRNRKELHLTDPDTLDKAVRSLLDPSLRLLLVPRDGNCMFRALAHCLGGCISHGEVRRDLVTHVVTFWNSNENEFGEFVRIAHADETVETYKKRMLGRGKDWGDYPELVAAAVLYQHHIQVLELVDTEQPLSSITIEVPGLLDDEAPTIHIVRVGQNHYHAGIKPTAHLLYYEVVVTNDFSTSQLYQLQMR